MSITPEHAQLLAYSLCTLAGLVAGVVATSRWYEHRLATPVQALQEILRDPQYHDFLPAMDGSDTCAHIVEGETWTALDPVRCRQPRAAHRDTSRGERVGM